MCDLLYAMQCVGTAPPAVVRKSLRELGRCIIESGLDIAQECAVFHHFAPGVYIREFSAKAGTLAVGRTHKTAHLSLFLKGRMFMLTPSGGLELLQAPAVIYSEVGEQRCALALEDIVFMTVHATACTDVNSIQDELTFPGDSGEQDIL